MIAHKEYLRLRRETLVALSAAHRSEIAYLGANLQRSLHWVDRAVAIARSASVLPVLAVAAALLLLRAPRHRLLLWSGRLFTVWRLFAEVRKQRSLH